VKHLLLTTIAAVVLATTTFADPIHDAARTGDLAGVQAELNKGVNVNAKDEDGQTPLHEAANWGHKETAELLIANGADVNARTGGWLNVTPLHRAETKEIAELLIANGADVNAKDGTGRTPLHWTAETGRKEIAELLIEKGADLNAKDDAFGWTPLHIAALFSYKEIAELLIVEGADANAKGEEGETPLDVAVDEDSTETADILRKHGGRTAEELALMPRLEYGKNQWPFDFSFTAKKGKTYVVEVTQDFKQWGELETIKGKGKQVKFIDPRQPLVPFKRNYYRVKLVE